MVFCSTNVFIEREVIAMIEFDQGMEYWISNCP
ncbi:hypothetical protein SAMN05443582_10740 [Phyllobacterium sp. OV277]|nr:hypothetical protein SAMN05443582_10740 [Phyllobacterium sp. OV277]